MIVAAVLMLFGGGGGGLQLLPFDFDNRVEQVVPEGIRRDSILALHKQSLEVAKDYGKDVDDQLDAYFKVVQGHDMPIDSLTPLVNEVKYDYMATSKMVLEVRRQIMDLLTPEEWDTVFAPEADK